MRYEADHFADYLRGLIQPRTEYVRLGVFRSDYNCPASVGHNLTHLYAIDAGRGEQ